jgi:hypothetical protein
MDLTYAAILVLAAAVFVLSGMVGYIYWRHTRLQQSVQSLSIVVSSLVTPAELEEPPADLANIPEVADEPEEGLRHARVAFGPFLCVAFLEWLFAEEWIVGWLFPR